jgi:phage tail-like protein
MADTPAVYDNFKSTLATDPIRNFKFVVTFEPIDGDKTTWTDSKLSQMGFVSVSGLSASIESIAYREGGYNTNVHQIPGQTSFTPITFSKGVLLGQTANQSWFKRIFALLSQQPGVGVATGFRCNTTIKVLSHPNPGGFGPDGTASITGPGGQHVSMEFKVYNCWITALSYGNLDAGANALMVEEMTMVHEGFDVAIASSYTASATIA